jgi:magnesium chelatase family protein
MIGSITCAGLCGFGAKKVKVEVDILRGLPAFCMVGLAENSVKEARVRVQSAITNCGFEFPSSRISINLAPADVPKDGTGFDLSIALGVLQAMGVLTKAMLQNIACISELSLSGELKPIKGILSIAECLKEQGFKILIVAKENYSEASLIKDLDVRIAVNLFDIVAALRDKTVDQLPKGITDADISENCEIDLADVCGQEEAKRALLISAAGNHNLLFVGGPGSGKSMMANRLPSIMPPLEYEESLLVTKIHSIAGLTITGGLVRKRPFRSPHHSTTRAGLVGGGSSFIKPGEISLACNGVLFLDELLEFPRSVLEVLRQPLESGEITLSRALHNVTFPANFSLVAALNPCPCGNFGQPKKKCVCSSLSITRYQSRLSGPLLDRIDLHVDVPSLDLGLMTKNNKSESSKSFQERVIKARFKQHQRLGKNRTNGKMQRKQIKEFALLNKDAENFLLGAAQKLDLSARSFDRIIKVARSIADLDDSKHIETPHIREALHYRGSCISAKS